MTKPDIISASQIGTFEDCNRHWWFQRILRLPSPPASHFTFGTVLHAVLERWLSADSTGRVPVPGDKDRLRTGFDYDGKKLVWLEGPLEGQKFGYAVDLYPKGWDTTTERNGSTASVTPNEAKLIQRLVNEAVEQGIVRREPQTTVEREFLVNLIEGVQLTGYIDVHRNASATRPNPVIEDHKSYGKGSIRFLTRSNSDSPNFLGSNQQLKTYAWAISETDQHFGDVDVRHNQFPKFPGRPVTHVDATITDSQITGHGEYLTDVAERMQRTRKVKKWDDVPGPEDTGKCARWYGKPCPFSDICGRTETPEAYRTKVDKLIERQGSTPRLNVPLAPAKRGATNKSEATSVSIFDRARQQKANRAALKEQAGSAAAGAAVAEATPAINGSTPNDTPAPAINGAPWANQNCRACKSRGMTTKGRACPICDATSKRAKRPTSAAYVVELDEAGLGVAVAREEHEEALEAAGMALEWVEAEAVQEAAEQAASVEPAIAQTTATINVDAEVEVTSVATAVTGPRDVPPKPPAASKPKGKSRGRPALGLTVLVGAIQLRGPSRPTFTSSEVLERFGDELATDMGAESYWALDTFKRRERLAQKAAYIVGELAKSVVVHPGILGNDDVGSLVQALMSQSEGVDSVIVRAG